jgi:hypothetical protein
VTTVLADHGKLHLAILGPHELYHCVAKNHIDGKVLNAWLTKDQVLSWVEERNREGYCCWISLNDKEKGNDTIKGVCALCDFWIDIDSNRPDKSRTATREELEEALSRAAKLKEHIEITYGAVGFLANSGNGFHLHFPLPSFELVGDRFREEVNLKVRSFAKKLAVKVGVEIDSTYDIRRVTTLIGSLNLKIPSQPLETRWDKNIFEKGLESALAKVEDARKLNHTLLEAILNEEIAKPKQEVAVSLETCPEFEDILKRDEKLHDLYGGSWQKYGYKSRSEGEEALLVKLVRYGFGDSDIHSIMEGSQIGKWKEKDDGYKQLSITKAREYVSQHKAEKETQVWFDRKDLAEKPYKGKTPYCIHQLEKGTTEGLRNEYGIRLASFYGNFKQYKTEICLKILGNWNKLNEPSLEKKEIETLLRSALQGSYVYGCNDPILKSVCNREQCSLATKPQKVLTETEKATAEKLLADSKLLDHVLAYGRKRLIGEDDILLQNFVFMVSGQTRYPISEVLTGYSGSGKNESVRAVKPLIPREWLFEFTTSTPEAIKYIPEEFAGTLVIYELAGVRSETGTLGLRSIGEGEGIKTIYPIRDEVTGEMKLGEKQTSAKNFISTESGLDIAADLYRRVFKNSMNDSLKLTRRVFAKKLRDSSLPESLRKKLFPEQIKEAYQESDFQNALRLLDLKAEVVIFPPSSLLDLIKLAVKKEQEVALRSQIDRILNFIRILALIHQKQRIRFKDDTNNYVIATPYDVEMALRILETSITETVSRIEKRQQQALDVLEKCPMEGLDKNGLAEKLHISTKTAYRILKTLADNGYVKQIETSKPFLYKIVDIQKLPSALSLLDNIREYKAFYEIELKRFLDRLRTTGQNGTPYFLVEGLETHEKSQNLEEKGIAECPDVQMPSDKEANSIPEIELKSWIFSGKGKQREVKREKQAEEWIVKREGNKVFTKHGEVMYQCPHCKAQEKPMFFSSEHDLKLHAKAWHGGYPDPDYVR